MTAKITVSLPDHLVEHARAAVEEGRAASVSAYVAQALQQKADREPIGDFFEMFDEKWGPPTEEDTAWAREQLDRADREMAEKKAKGLL
ncbi:ribbon-helix-helix domain-containing protein [Nocardioides sp. BYT-33-1]|uniref:ribbon-helix-helix domain-containing protein n=1 Tax=Nocardioides sp. BYT-33-1 TaxID=3416952 RepID=UPI003F537BA2